MPAGYPPVIFLAGIAKLSYDVRQTWALSGMMITWSRGLVGAQYIASTILAILAEGISVETGFANLTIETVGIKQTLETTTGVRIAITGTAQVRIVTTVAWVATTTGYLGITEVILGTVFASWPRITLETFANYILRH